MLTHKLDLDALSIESFVTVEAATNRGTVYAHVATDPTCYDVGCNLTPVTGQPVGDGDVEAQAAVSTDDEFASLQRTCTWSMKSACGD